MNGRTWLGVGALVVSVAAIAVGATVTRDSVGTGRHESPRITTASCPQTLGDLPDDGYWVPERPDGFDAGSHLVPVVIPNSAVVCAYLADKRPEIAGQQPASALTGTREITGGLDAFADLGELPAAGDPWACTSILLPTDGDYYLVGLNYDHASVWVSAPGNHCRGSSNGDFSTRTNLREPADAAFRTGTWP